jgi:hypothetical protein
MIRLVNRLTGTEMWVHGSRLKEYLAAGHVPAAAPTQEQGAEEGATPDPVQDEAKATAAPTQEQGDEPDPDEGKVKKDGVRKRKRSAGQNDPPADGA